MMMIILEVTVDRARNRTADTGGFDMVYRWQYAVVDDADDADADDDSGADKGGF